MQARPKLMLLVVAALLAAGCAGIEESRDRGDGRDANERRLAVDLPEGATRLEVDVTATSRGGDADVTILVEDGGANLHEDTFDVSGTETRTFSVDVAGRDSVTIVVRVVDGDAELDLEARAFVPTGPPVVVVRERIVIEVRETTPPPTPTPTATTPAPTPTPTPPPPPTNATNSTPANTTTNTTG